MTASLFASLASVAFYAFAAVLVVSAALVVSARNAVHSVLFLILAFFNAAGLFLLAGAEFLAMILVIVYVGAVAVLFLFVVMMLDVNFAQLREGLQRYAPVGLAVGVVLFTEIIFAVRGYSIDPALANLRVAPTPSDISNTAALAQQIYTHDILLFQIAGLVLLVAMIGAIVLTLRDKPEGRRQSIARQIARRVEETLVVLDPKPNAGIPVGEFLRPTATEPPFALDAPGATSPALHNPALPGVGER